MPIGWLDVTTQRPYKEPWPLERVVQTVKENAGSHFEPRLVEAFLSILPQILGIQAEWATARDE